MRDRTAGTTVPARTPPPALEAEVIVVGGGTAGCIAAIAAAQEGARVVLLEQDASLGGVGTRGGIHLYWYGLPGGFQDVVDREVRARTGVFGGRPRGFHPEAKRSVLAEMMLRYGVTVVFGALVVDILKDGVAVAGVVAQTAEGPLTVRGAVTVDATGDGDIAAAAGADSTLGRAGDGAYQTYSLVPRRVEEGGRLNFLNFDVGWLDPLDPWDVSRALLAGRGRLGELARGDRPLSGISSELGVRESRHIAGEYVLTFADIVQDRRFPDVVFRCFSHYDNHAFDFGSETDQGQIWTVILGLFRHGIKCGIPYRCFLPRGVDGLLVACRALSLERDAAMAVRMQREMQKAGEVAGVAAAMAARQGTSPRRVDIRTLQDRLLERGILSPEDLDPVPAPSIGFEAGPLAALPLTREVLAPRLAQLLAYLGGDEEGKALWWLSQFGDPAAALLREMLVGATDADRRRAAAFGLALLGRPEAAAALLDCVTARDPSVPVAAKAYPRWIAALTLLRILGIADAYPLVLRALDEPHPPKLHSFLLRYLGDLAHRVDAAQGREAADRLVAWSRTAGLGDDYIVSGGKVASLRWSLLLTVATILGRLGDGRALELCAPLLTDERAFVRDAARRIAEGLPRVTEGSAPEAPGRARAPRVATLPPATVSPGGPRARLGIFDVAVIGGGIAGTVCAASLAERGLAVVVVEPRGALMWELTRARRTELRAEEIAELSPAAAGFLDALADADGLRETRLDPVVAQLVADRFLTDRGVRPLFHAQALEARWDAAGALVGLDVASKGGRGELTVRACVDCSDAATILRRYLAPDEQPPQPPTAIWCLTLDGCSLDTPMEIGLPWRGVTVGIRVHPTVQTDRCQVDVAYPLDRAWGGTPELAFGRDVADLLAGVRQAVPALKHGRLVQVSEEPWIPSSFVLSGTAGVGRGAARRVGPLLSAEGRDDAGQARSLLDTDFPRVGTRGELVGGGPWLAPLHRPGAPEAPWQQRRTAVSNLFLIGEAVSQLVGLP